MNLLSQTSPPSARRFWKVDVPLAALISAIITKWMIAVSTKQYRLLKDIEYDDCGYFADGLLRLTELTTKGLAAFGTQWREYPPGAPFQTLMTMSAFTIFGVNDWAPFAMNAVPYFVYVLGLFYAARNLPPIGRLAAVVMGCLINYVCDAIAVFRPEFPSSVFLAVAVLLVAEKPIDHASKGKLALAGALWGLSLLAKPTFTPLTVCVFLLAIAVSAMHGGLLSRKPSTTRSRLLGRSLLPLVIALPLILSHFPIAFARLYQYVYDVQFGATASIWRVDLPFSGHLFYFLTGGGGSSLLGRHLYLLLVLIIWALVEAIYFRQKETLRVYIRLILPMLVAFAIPTANLHKQYCFGWGFQVMLTLTATVALSYIATANIVTRREILIARFCVPLLAAFLAIYLLKLPKRKTPPEGPRFSSVIFQELLQAASQPSTLPAVSPESVKPIVCYFPSGEGPINPGTFYWISLREKAASRFQFTPGAIWATAAEHHLACQQADYVIMPRFKGETNFLPSSNICNELSARLDADPQFKCIRRTASNRADFLVYRRIGVK